MIGTLVGLIGIVYGIWIRDGNMILISCALIAIDNKEVTVIIKKG